MQAILRYWLAAQHQASTLRQQIIGLFEARFSANFNELKVPKIKFSGKTSVGVVQRLKVKRQVKSPRGVLKEVSLIIF